MITRFTPLLLLLCSSATAAKEPLRPRSLLEEMHTLSVVDKELKDRLPTYYNQYLVTGYFEMPSARMAPEGVVAASIGKIGNAFIYGINVQVLDQLELAGNYRTFGDKVGLNGDVSPDRTGHIKIQIPVPTNGLHSIPYVALGIEQSLGTGHYTSLYGALTQEFLSKNLELSIGWGAGGINGLFGAAAWTPFRKKDNNFFNALSLIVEYDATRKISVAIDSLNTSIVPINFGASMLIEDYLQCSLFSAGGKTLAGNISLRYPIGTTHGLFLKKNDPKLFKKPKQEKAATPDWATSIEAGCKEQKLPIIKMAASRAGDGEFWMVIANPFYRDINEALERVLLVLEGLIPEHLLLLHITVQSDGCPIQTYTLTRAQLLSLTSRGMRRAEIKERLIVSSPKPFPTPYETQLLYENKKPIINWGITPRALVLFGGNEGFLKYHIDALLGVSGTLWNRLFFDFTYSYPIVGSLANLAAANEKNASQLFTVRTDTLKYYGNPGGMIEKAYIQRSQYLGANSFGRGAVGFFEPAYAGGSLEYLWYPVGSRLAAGVEFALLKKRSYDGFGFQNKVRILQDKKEVFRPFTAYQCFLDLYYFMPIMQIDCKVSIGQFLAKDNGARFELERYFDNGFSIGVWYTVTDARDLVNNMVYREKGISFSIPLDFFLYKSSRKKIAPSASIWLRDSGARGKTGKRLYTTIREERR